MAHFPQAPTLCEVTYDSDWYDIPDDRFLTPYRYSLLRNDTESQSDTVSLTLPSYTYYEYLRSLYDCRSTYSSSHRAGYPGPSESSTLVRSNTTTTWPRLGKGETSDRRSSRQTPQSESRARTGYPFPKVQFLQGGGSGDELEDCEVSPKSKEKLVWVDALNKWVPEAQVHPRPYMSFIGNAPVVEKLVRQLKEEGEKLDLGPQPINVCERYESHQSIATSKSSIPLPSKDSSSSSSTAVIQINRHQANAVRREANRKRVQEAAEQRRSRKSYSSPVYTTLAQRKQKSRLQMPKFTTSTPASPTHDKDKPASPREVWNDRDSGKSRGDRQLSPIKREISVTLISPKPDTDLDDSFASSDSKEKSDKKVKFKDGLPDGKSGTKGKGKDWDDQDSSSTSDSAKSANQQLLQRNKNQQLIHEQQQRENQERLKRLQEQQLHKQQEQQKKQQQQQQQQQKLEKEKQQEDEEGAKRRKGRPPEASKGKGKSGKGDKPGRKGKKDEEIVIPTEISEKSTTPSQTSNVTPTLPKKEPPQKKGFKQIRNVLPKKAPPPPLPPKTIKPMLAGMSKSKKLASDWPKQKEEKLPVSGADDLLAGENTEPPKTPVETKKPVRQVVKKERRERACVKKPVETTTLQTTPEVAPKAVQSWIFNEDFSSDEETKKKANKGKLSPTEASEPQFLLDLKPSIIEVQKGKQQKRRKSVLQNLISTNIIQKSRLGRPEKDSSYLDELRRMELAEERRKRQMEMLEKRRARQNGQVNGEGDDGSPHFEDYGFLAKYCIFTKGNMDMYKHAFEAVDDQKNGHLEGQDVMIALRGVNNKLTEAEEEYLYRILELTGYKVTNGADFKMFSVLAALSQRITTLDHWMKNIIGQMDFKALEMKMFMCKTLWECNVDPETNKIPIDQLCVELRAGGVSVEHELEVREKLSHIQALDLFDFLTYVPLFITIHESVVKNPLDDSREM